MSIPNWRCFAFDCKYYNTKEGRGCMKAFGPELEAIIGAKGTVTWICPNWKHV
jgi:hypothetical protein